MTDRNRDESRWLSMLTEAVFATVGKQEGLGWSIQSDRPTLECVKAAYFVEKLILAKAIDIDI